MIDQYLPEAIGFAAGYLGGSALDKSAARNAHSAVTAALRTYGVVKPVEDTELEDSRVERVLTYFERKSPKLALSLGLTAAMMTAAYYPLGSNVIKPAAIEVVVDHSGGTKIRVDGQNPVLPEINHVAKAFTSSDRITSTAFVGGSNGVTETKISKIDSIAAYADAPLDVAVNSALDQTALIKNGNKKRDAAIVVITNGNTIGSTAAVISKSTSQNKTPVYIVNVESSNTTSPENISSYKTIAKDTGAKYWSAESININTITKDVEQTLSPENKPTKINPNKGLDVFVALAAGLISVKEYRQRKRGQIKRNLRGK